MATYKTIEDCVGNTPLVRLKRMQAGVNNTFLLKLEGSNPAGSVKDRPALAMIMRAEARGDIQPGDTLVEATSGNTGIALAMAAAVRNYRMILVMPENQSVERRQTMRAYGAELVLTPSDGGMEMARDIARNMQREGRGKVLDQFANPDNPYAHYATTGPEIWQQTDGGITHFVSSMGTTGTLVGCARYLKEQNAGIRVIGCQPDSESNIPGTRKWERDYQPVIFDGAIVDEVNLIDQAAAEHFTRCLARDEGIFAGISTGAVLAVMLASAETVQNATFVGIACDRGDRYLSTGVFPA